MESWQRTLSQFRDLFNTMAPSQRMTLVVVPLLVLAGLGLVMYFGANPAQEALLMGKAFSPDELKNAETALRKAGYVQYHVEGQKILAPRADAARYNAALITSDVADSFGREFGKALDRNPLTGTAESNRQAWELARSIELTNMIKEIPYVQNARIVWEPKSKSAPFGRESKPTAVLSVMPRPGHELSSDEAQTLRQAVAGCFGMRPTDVTVMDAKAGKAPRLPGPDDGYNSGYFDAISRYTAFFQSKIAGALQDIPNAIVTVNVQIDSVAASTERERKYDTKAFPYKSIEDSQKEESSEAAPQNEPGVKANQPLSSRTQAVAKQSRSNEKTLIKTDSVPTGTKETVSEKVGFTPRAVQASVSIPKDYYRDVLVKQGVDEADKTAFQAKMLQIQSEKEKEIRARVAPLIVLAGVETASDAINVGSYDRHEAIEPPATISLTAQIGEAVSQWGGAAGLALFALWALIMLNRSVQRTNRAASTSSAKVTAGKGAPAAAAPVAEDDELSREPTKRDKLQTLVKDNPEMAATVISRWLTPPK
jgi:flagellar biosynthesis/type III secretory pathway M-ring protein FliF/YscJ